MHHKKAIILLILSAMFAASHYVALLASLYWYLWWFDILMHFWAGVIIVLGLHTLSTFVRLHFNPTLFVVVITLFVMTLSWEAFEFWAKLWQPESYIRDTLYDILTGFSGGLLTHVILDTYRIK